MQGGPLDFVQFVDSARLGLGETTLLGVPSLILRTTTEQPVTVAEGTNRLVDP